MTAVEFLVDKYNNCPKYHAVLTESDFTQAKELERQQQGYSEEEVLVLLHKRDKHSMDKSLTFSSWQTPKEWFEQFKKKYKTWNI